MIIVLPFPPSALAGHNNGTWRKRDKVVATYRAEAFHLTRDALRKQGFTKTDGDIAISIRFIPTNERGDRVNYPIRIKCQLDGIAEALGVNDKQFLPSYIFEPACKPGRVEVILSPLSTGGTSIERSPESAGSAIQNAGRESGCTLDPSPAQSAIQERTE